VIPPEFDYAAPSSLDEVFTELSSGDDVKLLAGGHSLLPLIGPARHQPRER
jgi:carbon-monoxide dehydrogenase medium subunit